MNLKRLKAPIAALLGLLTLISIIATATAARLWSPQALAEA